MRSIKLISAAAAAAALAGAAQASPIVVANSDATALANAIAGSGITVSNAVLTTDTVGGNGLFINGGSTVGFGNGIALTNGTLACIAGPNDNGQCSGNGMTSELAFDFTSATGEVHFEYVFASDEYNSSVGSDYNDTFEVLLNGINIALLPGGAGPISVNNVNCLTNAAYYRNNSNEVNGGGVPCPGGSPNLGLNIQYDGLTVVLTASGVVNAGLNHLVFRIHDAIDGVVDSAVFIKAGSLSANPVPEPGSLPLVATALAGLATALRRNGATTRNPFPATRA